MSACSSTRVLPDASDSVDAGNMDANPFVDEASMDDVDASMPDALADDGPEADGGPEAEGCTFPPTCPLAPGCPDVPRTCPAPPPSYAQDIARILSDNCIRCHHAGSTVAPGDFTTYALFRNYKPGTAYVNVLGCVMPPPDAGTPMPADDRAKFIEWCACGYPNN
jgi:hypothetical protein